MKKSETPKKSHRHIDKIGLFLAIVALAIGVSSFIWSQLIHYNTIQHTVMLPFSMVPLLLWPDNTFAHGREQDAEPEPIISTGDTEESNIAGTQLVDDETRYNE